MSIKTDPESLIDKKFLKIPYVLGGKSLQGADCIGLLLMWLNDQGIYYEYDDKQGEVLSNWWEKNPQRFMNAFLKEGKMVRGSDIKKGDCLLFILGHEGNTFPNCAAVMIDDRHFLMTLNTDDRRSFVAMLDMFWKNKIWGAIRLHKVIEKFGE